MTKVLQSKVFVVYVDRGGENNENLTSAFRSLNGAQRHSRDKCEQSQEPHIVEYEAVAVHRPVSWKREKVKD